MTLPASLRHRQAWLMLLSLPLLAACEKAKQDMYDQPRYKTFAASALFEDGASARVAPDGTQPRARGPLAGSSSGRLGADTVRADLAAGAAEANPYPPTLALLERGRDRYMIYCTPCHSPVGDGDGMVVRRGFPAPPTYHQERLRHASDRYLFDVITKGYGVMVPYADRIEPAERWAIVAFIRALQFSQHAPVAALPAHTRARIEANAAHAANAALPAQTRAVNAEPAARPGAPSRAPKPVPAVSRTGGPA